MPKSHQKGEGIKTRLDALLVKRGVAGTLKHAQTMIMAGCVHSTHTRLDKPGATVNDTIALTVKTPATWVSRAGDKLAYALKHFAIDPQGAICLDIGANVGGFSHVLVAHKAQRVYAVDTDYGRLNWRLRQNPTIVLVERCNARYLSREHIPEAVDMIVCDVSFVSLRTVLPPAMALASEHAVLCALIKPQFEAPRHLVGARGILKEARLYPQIARDVGVWLDTQTPWQTQGIIESPVALPNGNKEYLIKAQRVVS
ncbi:MAG: TlyA family RNA methyltransferase [Alphaproteobacteria bacterium GM202ARS2]|nr:TlyA family RNA methyltransferase [Alphaproteobacteria bacterium GM202ARS2]